MTKEEIIEFLGDRKADIQKIDAIFESHKDDNEIVGQIAMNLSQRTSVYDRELEASETMAQLLIKLSDVDDMGSRWAVAKNPHTPIEILEKLAKDKINLVRALVATNPNTPSDVLSKLFNDEKIVRDGLSGNPNTPQKLIKTLSDDSDKMVRLRIAENPSTPKEILEKLLKDAEPNVAKAAEVHLG